MKKLLKYILTPMFVMTMGSAYAQESQGFYETYQIEIILGLAVLVCVVALIALIVCLYALVSVFKVRTSTSSSLETAEGEEQHQHISFWRRLLNKMNDSVPISQEHTVHTGHEYDGIHELDNKLPPWWVYMFYATIIFSVGYILHYHVFKTGDLQEVEYEKEVSEARLATEAYLASLDEIIDETTVTSSTNPEDLVKGREIYSINCAPCHGPDGGGTVGPNLTDQYWIHGGTVQKIFATIKYGVPAKGMIPWESQLSPKQMQQVASYIVTLEGTTPASPKAPEGEKFVREQDVNNQDVREEIIEDAATEDSPEVPASLDGRELELENEQQ